MLHYFLRRQFGFSWLWSPDFIHLFLFLVCFEMAHLRRLETKQVNLDISQHENQRDRVKERSVSWELFTFLFARSTQYFSSALSSMYKSLCCVCEGFFFFFLSIGTLQCCVSFCSTMKWISYLYTCIPSLFQLPPSHPFTSPQSSPHVIQQVPTSHLFPTW